MGGRGSSSGQGATGGGEGAPLTPEREASLILYQGFGHGPMNESLRKGTGEHKDNIKNVSQLMSKSKEDQTVYRGLDGRISSAIYRDVNGRPGSIIRDKGFQSTSKDPMVARQFASYGSYRLAINVKAGSKTIDVNKTLGKKSMQPGEKEVILNKGTALKYIKTDEVSKIMHFETI